MPGTMLGITDRHKKVEHMWKTANTLVWKKFRVRMGEYENQGKSPVSNH